MLPLLSAFSPAVVSWAVIKQRSLSLFYLIAWLIPRYWGRFARSSVSELLEGKRAGKSTCRSEEAQKLKAEKNKTRQKTCCLL